MGAGYGPPYYWMCALPKHCHVISQFSDLPQHRSGRVVWWFKQHWYRRVFERSSLVLAVTQDTADLLQSVGQEQLGSKLRMTGLSYDAADFTLNDGASCPDAAAALADRVKFLVAVVTRVTPEKGLDALFEGVEAFLERHADAGLVMAGFRDDAYGETLRARIERSSVRERCCLLPVLGTAAINGLLARAGCSLWTQVSIGLQHSLASGCPIVLRRGWPAGHILKEGLSGFTFEGNADLGSVLEKAKEHSWDRKAIHGVIEPFQSESMLRRLFGELGLSHFEGEPRREGQD